jgi:hypothetical protein
MNLPDVAGNRRTRGQAIAQHTSHRESNPAHFFVNGGLPKILLRPADALATGGRLPPKTPLCPFSIQGFVKTDAKNPQVNR